MVLRNPFKRLSKLLARDVASISSLDDPVRSAVYFYVAGAVDDVSRDEAAHAVGVSRRVAAFHLDRLVRDGWLDVTFRRLGQRTGPGAGRTSKLYRRSAQRASVSVPARNYELMTRLLTSAVRRARGSTALREMEPGAREFGAKVGGSIQPQSLSGMLARLADEGFEPVVDPAGVVRMRNCPYHEVSRENRDLTCGLNLAFMDGLTAGAGVEGVTAVLEPQPGWCCVALRS